MPALPDRFLTHGSRDHLDPLRPRVVRLIAEEILRRARVVHLAAGRPAGGVDDGEANVGQQAEGEAAYLIKKLTKVG
jgi:hypothetical protein